VDVPDRPAVADFFDGNPPLEWGGASVV